MSSDADLISMSPYTQLITEGRGAMARGAWEEAFGLFSRAVELQETPEALEQLGMAAYWHNDGVITFDARERAYRLYKANLDHLGAARIASLLAVDYVEFKGDIAVATGWLSRARRVLDGLDPSPELGFVKTLEAHIALMVEKDTVTARRIAAEAIEIGRSLNASYVEILGLALEGLAMVSEGEVAGGMRLLDEATAAAVAGETDDLNAIGTACCYLISACDRVRDYDRAAQWCERVADFCRRWRCDSLFGSCRIQYASILMSQGKWEEAERELNAAITMLRQSRPGSVNPCIVRLGELRRRQGRWEEAEEMFAVVPSHPLSLLGRAALALDRDDSNIALDYAARYLRRIPLSDRVERVQGLDILIRASSGTGAFDQARNALAELQEIVEQISTDPLRAVALCCHGILLMEYGEGEKAMEFLEDAVDLYERTPMPFEAGVARILLARTTMNLGMESRAREELSLALSTLEEIGAKKMVEWGMRVLGNPPGSTKRGFSGSRPIDFTPREEEVLDMIALGLNNDEIAERLFLSTRTVERHISNIYQKIGASGKSARVLAASWATKKTPASS